MKLGDFGSALVGELSLRDIPAETPVEFEEQTGSFAYEAPDRYLNGSYGRKSDVWSIGCAFLKILVWAFLPSDSVDTFGDRRFGPESESFQHDGFWEGTDHGQGHRTASLKDAVIECFIKLIDLPVFDSFVLVALVQLVEDMLKFEIRDSEPVVARRIRSFHLASSLRALRQEAEARLEVDPSCFRRRPTTGGAGQMEVSRLGADSPAESAETISLTSSGESVKAKTWRQKGKRRATKSKSSGNDGASGKMSLLTD